VVVAATATVAVPHATAVQLPLSTEKNLGSKQRVKGQQMQPFIN
jgi:hypothetical protein